MVGDQHLALAHMVGLADDAFALHPLDDPGGAVIADLEMALHEAGGGLALGRDQRHGPVVERVFVAALVESGTGGFGLPGAPCRVQSRQSPLQQRRCQRRKSYVSPAASIAATST